jgi:hypothetical protein
MLRDVGIALQKRLAARGCPIPVTDALDEKPNAATYARERIVLERDPAGDSYKAPRGTSSLSRRRGPTFRLIGCRAVIYVREPRAGAMPFEHVQRAEKVIDYLLITIDETLRADAKCRCLIVGGAFEPIEDLAASEKVTGARYVLRFQIERGLVVQTWKGVGPTLVQIGGVSGINIQTDVQAAIDGGTLETLSVGRGPSLDFTALEASQWLTNPAIGGL